MLAMAPREGPGCGCVFSPGPLVQRPAKEVLLTRALGCPPIRLCRLRQGIFVVRARVPVNGRFHAVVKLLEVLFDLPLPDAACGSSGVGLGLRGAHPGTSLKACREVEELTIRTRETAWLGGRWVGGCCLPVMGFERSS